MVNPTCVRALGPAEQRLRHRLLPSLLDHRSLPLLRRTEHFILRPAHLRPLKRAGHFKSQLPAVCLGCDVKEITGSPDPKHISTSYVERQNLTMRMSMRRFTRLTNAFSKKVENHAAAISLYFMWYNFGRVHQTLRVTPAMEAGVANHVWSVEEIVGLLG
jgi:hypothetical protein